MEYRVRFQTRFCLCSIPQVVWLREDAEGNVDIRDMEQKLQVRLQIHITSITKSLTNL